MANPKLTPIRIERHILDYRGALNPPQLTGTGYESCRVIMHAPEGDFAAVCARSADDQSLLSASMGAERLAAAQAFAANATDFRVERIDDVRLPPNVLNQMFAGAGGALKCVKHPDADVYACSNLRAVSTASRLAYDRESKMMDLNDRLAHKVTTDPPALAAPPGEATG